MNVDESNVGKREVQGPAGLCIQHRIQSEFIVLCVDLCGFNCIHSVLNICACQLDEIVFNTNLRLDLKPSMMLIIWKWSRREV